MSSLSNHKKLLVFALLLILVSVIFLISKLQPTSRQGSSEKPSSRKLVVSEGHPSIFYAVLELDPNTNVVTQITSGQASGDLPYLSPEKPQANIDNLIYRIEVVSDKNLLLQSGWDQIGKKLVLTPQNTLKFRITTQYQKNAFVKIYLPDGKLIWTGKIT